MLKTHCPACQEKILIDKAVKPGVPVECARCGEEWVVSTIHPLRLDYAFDGPLEAADFSVRSRSRGPFRAEL